MDREIEPQQPEQEVCPECDGNGFIRIGEGDSEGKEQCPTCQGRGIYSPSQRGSDGFERCSQCNGEGKVLIGADDGIDCKPCHGTGQVSKADPDREKILSLLVSQCQTHEHRGCDCSPEEAEGCWGSLVDQILALIPEVKRQEREEALKWLEYNAPEFVWQRFKDGVDVR